MELGVISGYLGSFWGSNDTLKEEIIGCVLWSSREAFAASIPPGILHDVKLYRRAL
jgi:hypothetical protein